MTIRFVTGWNGYHADQIVSGLGSTEETRLIGLGYAVSDLNGPGNTPVPVTATSDPLTGGIGILASGVQVGGNGAPYAFTSRALTDADNGMNLVCASAQTATVPAGRPVGFGCSFEGAISFTAGSGVTITDLRATGASDIFCALMCVGTDTYKVRGGAA